MPDAAHQRAVFIKKTDKRGRTVPAGQQAGIPVHFNPETLDLTYTNRLQKGNRDQPAKVVSETTAKLSMQLVFDTTMPGVGGADGQSRAGKDVRLETIKIVQLMDPSQVSPRKKTNKGDVPSIVAFKWGAFFFEGYIDSFKETIELFSPEGIPLRATVTISMTQQQRSKTPDAPAATSGLTGGPDPFAPSPGAVPGGRAAPSPGTPVTRAQPDRPVSDVAERLGDPAGMRALGEQNRLDSLRFPEVDELVVSGAQQRLAPGLSGAGAGIPGGAGRAVGATEALFSGLRGMTDVRTTPTPRTRLSVDVEPAGSRGAGIGANASFGISGEMDVDTGVSMSADVGQSADIELSANRRG